MECSSTVTDKLLELSSSDKNTNDTEAKIILTLDALDQINDNTDDIGFVINLIKCRDTRIRKKVLKIIYTWIKSIDSDSDRFMIKYESLLTSYACLSNFSKLLRHFNECHPDFSTAKVFIILLHLAQHSDKLTIETLELSNCLQEVLAIFIKCMKLFTSNFFKISWSCAEYRIFLIVWRAISLFFSFVVADQVYIADSVDITPTNVAIFNQAIKFCKLYLKGIIIHNNWKTDLHVGVFHFVRKALKIKKYLIMFHSSQVMGDFIRWLSTDLRPNEQLLNAGYIIRIIFEYVVNYPEESLKMIIIQNLFQFIGNSRHNMCKQIYLGRTYCALGDICNILNYLLNHTKFGIMSFPFVKSVPLIIDAIKSCREDCISKIFAFETIFIVKDVFETPHIKELFDTELAYSEILDYAKVVEKQIDLINDIVDKIRNFQNKKGELDFPNIEFPIDIPYEYENTSSEPSPEYDSSSFDKDEEDCENDEKMSVDECLSLQSSESDCTKKMDISSDEEDEHLYIPSYIFSETGNSNTCKQIEPSDKNPKHSQLLAKSEVSYTDDEEDSDCSYSDLTQ